MRARVSTWVLRVFLLGLAVATLRLLPSATAATREVIHAR